MGRNLWLAMAALVSMVGSAQAQTWTPIPMPDIVGWSTEQLNTAAPYALGVPPCSPPCNRHYRSNLASSVKGFRFRGDAIALGAGTSSDNQVAAFFTNSATYTGFEYGFVVYLPDGKMRLYQCANCNTAGQIWTDEIVWDTPGEYYSYEVLVNSDGSFTVEVVSTVSPYPIIATVNVAKASWLSNLYNTSGYVTITASHDGNDGGNWSASTLHVDQIDIRQ
jgi:hypothetical protein